MFKNRRDAGKKLSTKLMDLYNQTDLLVLGISVGGMVVADEIAKELNAPCDMLTVRKLRNPHHDTEPIGAIAIGGEIALNTGIIEYFNISDDIIEQAEIEERRQLRAKENRYRGVNAPAINPESKTIILVDDGMGTGATMRAAIDTMLAQGAKEVIVASPVSAPQVCLMFHGIADRTVCYATPNPFETVNKWYDEFDKPTIDAVHAILAKNTLTVE